MNGLAMVNDACLRIKQLIVSELVHDGMDEEERYEVWDRFTFNISFDVTDFEQNSECWWVIHLIDETRKDKLSNIRVANEDDCLSDFGLGPYKGLDFDEYCYIDFLQCLVSFDRVAEDVLPILKKAESDFWKQFTN